MAKPDPVGVLSALLGPALWGLMPLFYISLAEFSAFDVVVQRTLWSAILLGGFLAMRGRLALLKGYFRPGRQMALILAGSVLIAINWFVFIYAVHSGQVVEASFGYFIYPLLAVGFGVVLLSEKLDRRAQIALGLSAVGAVMKGISVGAIPDISLILAGSFAAYAVIRKQLAIDALDGLLCEVIWLLPIVFAALIWQILQGEPLFLGGGAIGVLLSISCGLATFIPLAFFLRGNKTLPLSLTGFLFYINPSLQLLVGVMLLSEPFQIIDGLAFGLIWLGLIIQFARGHKPVSPR